MNEEGARRLMTLLRDAGEASAALEVYRALRQRLSIELGQAPSAQTRRLADSLRGE
jgi:DNA-binding SARP family transcriptional activator